MENRLLRKVNPGAVGFLWSATGREGCEKIGTEIFLLEILLELGSSYDARSASFLARCALGVEPGARMVPGAQGSGRGTRCRVQWASARKSKPDGRGVLVPARLNTQDVTGEGMKARRGPSVRILSTVHGSRTRNGDGKCLLTTQRRRWRLQTWQSFRVVCPLLAKVIK